MSNSSSAARSILVIPLVCVLFQLLLIAVHCNDSVVKKYPKSELPDGFVELSSIDSSIIQEMRYFTYHNYVGHPIPGYDAGHCILTLEAAVALSNVQKVLMSMPPPGPYSLKVYDCYRPAYSVDYFVYWSQQPNDTLTKAEFYPDLDKDVLFPDGYIVYNSSHSRGSTSDLTIIPYPPPDQPSYQPGQHLDPCTNPIGHRWLDNSLDFGTGFDCFSPLAWTNSTTPPVGPLQQHNRQFLKNVMQSGNFVNYAEEWWHYTLANEPYPNTYFNFTVV